MSFKQSAKLLPVTILCSFLIVTFLLDGNLTYSSASNSNDAALDWPQWRGPNRDGTLDGRHAGNRHDIPVQLFHSGAQVETLGIGNVY